MVFNAIILSTIHFIIYDLYTGIVSVYFNKFVHDIKPIAIGATLRI